MPNFTNKNIYAIIVSGRSVVFRCDSPKCYKMLRSVTKLREIPKSTTSLRFLRPAKEADFQLYNNNKSGTK